MYSRVLRFAPSPNGYLHLGHAYSALLNSDMARELGGRLLLRIEDIDTERCRAEYEAAMYDDLRWIGMSWQEPVRRQSEHFADYELAIARLEADGLLYPSFESRRQRSKLAAAGRAIRTACRSIRGARADCPRPNVGAGARPENRSRCGSPWTRPWRAPGC